MLGDCHIHMVLDGICNYKEAMERHKAAPDEAFVRKTLAQYQKAGMTFEGTARQGGRNNRGIVDICHWAILRSDR